MTDWVKASIISLLVALAGLAALAISPWADIEQGVGLQWLFNLRGPIRPPDEVVVIAIDEASARVLRLDPRPRNWPRSVHAELVDHLVKAGASVICFDLAFEVPSKIAAEDAALALALRKAGNVVLIEGVRREPDAAPNDRVPDQAVPPLPVLGEAALAVAPFLLPKQSRVDHYWAFWTFHDGPGGEVPTLPVAAFRAHAAKGFARFADALGKAIGASHAEIQGKPGSMDLAATSDVLRDVLSDDRVYRRVVDELSTRSSEVSLEQANRMARMVASLYSGDPATYINFYGPPRSITTVSYAKVLEAARTDSGGAEFRNKAVFIGASSATQGGQDMVRDDYRTVFSRTDGLNVSGVEIAATAMANLVDGRVLRPLTPQWQSVIVFLWACVLGAVCSRWRPAQAAIVVSVLAAIYAAVTYERFSNASQWLPLAVPVGVQAPLALLCGLWLHFRDSHLERNAMKRAFSYFLPAGVVEQFSHNSGAVTQSNRLMQGTCMATDVANYTSLAERMAPDRLSELMSAYYAELFEPVETNRGVVVDVVGDAMIAIWNAPATDALRRADACHAAIDAVQALKLFNHTSNERPGLATRFGLHWGDMMLGSIGGSNHFEYRAVGDVVNTASRIQALNKTLHTQLLASQEAVHGVEGFVIRPVGSFLFPGKSNAVSVVEIVGRVGEVSDDVLSLCTRFANALEAYRAGQWIHAKAQWLATLELEPDDGPSRYYVRRCDSLLAMPPGDEWLPVIRVDSSDHDGVAY